MDITRILYGGMVFVDIVVANIWMAFYSLELGKSNVSDKWLKADTSAIEDLKNKLIHLLKVLKEIQSYRFDDYGGDCLWIYRFCTFCVGHNGPFFKNVVFS